MKLNMAIKQIFLIVLLTVFIAFEVVVTRECFASKASKLEPRQYFFKEVIDRSDSQLKLLQILYDSGRPLTPDLQKLFDLILKKASSNNDREQWMSLRWMVFLTGLSWHEDPDTLCLYANYLNGCFEIENGDTDIDKFNCVIDGDLVTHLDMHYRLIKHILLKNGCSIDNVPIVTLPDCFDSTKCINGGKVYLFDKIWQEYKGTLEENQYDVLEENDVREIYNAVKPMYDAKNLYENYVAAISTQMAMEYDWIVKSKLLNSEAWFKYMKAVGLHAELVTSTTKCNCEDLEFVLLSSIENYKEQAADIILHLKANKDLIESQGHVSSDKYSDNLTNKRNKHEF